MAKGFPFCVLKMKVKWDELLAMLELLSLYQVLGEAF